MTANLSPEQKADEEAGRVPTAPGSIASGDQAASHLVPSGDDPIAHVSYGVALNVPHAIMGGTRMAVNYRVKQWMRLGMPTGANVGNRGVKVGYTPEMLWELALMAELSRMGFTAMVAVKFVRENLSQVIAETRAGTGCVFRFGGEYSCIGIDGRGLQLAIETAISGSSS